MRSRFCGPTKNFSESVEHDPRNDTGTFVASAPPAEIEIEAAEKLRKKKAEAAERLRKKEAEAAERLRKAAEERAEKLRKIAEKWEKAEEERLRKAAEKWEKAEEERLRKAEELQKKFLEQETQVEDTGVVDLRNTGRINW